MKNVDVRMTERAEVMCSTEKPMVSRLSLFMAVIARITLITVMLKPAADEDQQGLAINTE